MTMTGKRRRAWWALTVVVAGGFLLTACSAGGGRSTSTSTAAAASPTIAASPTSRLRGCADTTALEAAVAALKDADLAEVGVDGLRAALTEVADELEAFAARAEGDRAAEITELRAAVDALVTTLTGLDDKATLRANLQAVRSAVGRVENAWAPLRQQVHESCP